MFLFFCVLSTFYEHIVTRTFLAEYHLKHPIKIMLSFKVEHAVSH